MLRQVAFHRILLFCHNCYLNGRSMRSVGFEVLWAADPSWISELVVVYAAINNTLADIVLKIN